MQDHLDDRTRDWDKLVSVDDQPELAIHKFAVANGIELINKSYGSVGPDAYVRNLFAKTLKCPVLGEVIIQESRLLHARIKRMGVYADSVPYLVLQSAGNESSKIDSENDTGECMIRNGNHILVGAYDVYNRVSKFSNFGNCVDFYALGSQVISASVGDMLLPVDGTSFSSPLAARFLSSFGSNPTTIKSTLAARLDGRKFLKMDGQHTSAIAFERAGDKKLSLTGAFPSASFFSHDWEMKKGIEEAFSEIEKVIHH